MKNKKIDEKELLILMAAGCLLGILCFAVVYGLKIVNPTYDGWLFFGDMDLKQHYVGFCHFRTSPWKFPIGLIDTLSVPYSMSVVYTDSIPLFALIFKLFSSVLPVHFQYFGLFGLMSFMLMGMLSPVLIRRYCENKIVCILGSLFFILSFPVIHRMYYHTALSAQWMIVLALIIWSYFDILDKENTKKLCLYWGIIGLVAVLIHSYFVFMTGIILAAQIVDGIVRNYYRNKAEEHNLFKSIIKCKYIFLPLICMGILSFATLYALGGFYGKGSVSGFGFGSFNANLSSYFNPLEFSSIFKGFSLYGDFEYEGFAYVGAGILLILAAIFVSLLIEKIKTNKNASENKDGNESRSAGKLSTDNNEKDLIDVHTKCVFLVVIIIVLLASCFPSFSIGPVKLFSIPVPKIMEKIFGICRTNARFVWVGMYIIITYCMWFVGNNIKKTWIKCLLALAVIIQLYEISGVVLQRHEKYAENYEFTSVWEQLESFNITDGREEFVFMYGDSDIMMDTAFYAYLHGMSQNSYYYARTIYDEINENIAEWSEKFLAGDLSNNVIYVFRDEDFTEDFERAVKKAQGKIYQFDGHVAVIK